MSKLSLAVAKVAPPPRPTHLPVVSKEAIASPGPEAIEAQVAAVVRTINEPDVLLEWLAQANALAAYLATRKGAQGPMSGAQRRIEARVGELLGPAENRGPATVVHDPRLRELDRGQREDFRLLARAYEDVRLSEPEWRHSRRGVVRLIRERLGLVPETPELPTGQFSTIVADPPWQLDTGEAAFGSAGEGHEGLAYFSMSLDDIRALGEKLADHLPENAHLYLWTTNRYVEAAYQVARDWGFRPSVLLVWAKAPLGIGLGDDFKLTTEFVLFARRGSLANLNTSPTTWFSWPRGGHSVKPDGFYELAERMSPGPRLDMFARTERPGWTAWGDEV